MDRINIQMDFQRLKSVTQQIGISLQKPQYRESV